MSDVQQAIVRAHGEQWARIVAVLVRVTGDWSLAEDAAADAFERALERWPVDGVPDRPAAWLTTVARNSALDRLRRSRTETEKLKEVATMRELEALADDDIPDERLRLLFTCAHPALPVEARVALTLRTVAGLTTTEIARAFLVSEPTMAQRLVRAKSKIVHAGIPYRVPPAEQLAERLDGVLHVIYLVFNAGYTITDDPDHDDALCREAIRLAELLTRLMPQEGGPYGLLALMRLQFARRVARTDAAGELVPLEEQDRARWDRAGIRAGIAALDDAVRHGGFGRYQLLAAIAAEHATAADFEATDASRIADLYAALARIDPSPVVALNAAIARGMASGPAAGLAAVERVAASGALDGYYLLPATLADFQRRLGRSRLAAEQYRVAIALTAAGPERRFLERRLAEMGG